MGNPVKKDEYDRAEIDRQLFLESGYDSSLVDNYLFGGRPQRAGQEMTPDITLPSLDNANTWDTAVTMDGLQQDGGLGPIPDQDGWAKYFGGVDKITNRVVQGAKEVANILANRAHLPEISKVLGQGLSHQIEKGVQNAEDAGEIMMGILQPATRAQQGWFNFISGKGLDDIVDAMYARNTVGHDPKTGLPIYQDNFDMAWEMMNAELGGNGDVEEIRAQLQEANERYYDVDFKYFSDVMDTWAGGGDDDVGARRMDAFYRDLMATRDPITVGLVTLGIAGNEIVQDPLFFASDLPVATGKGIRAGLSKIATNTMTKRALARAASKPTVTAALDGVSVAQGALKRAMERAAVDPSEAARVAVSSAENQYLKTLTRLKSMDNIGPFEIIAVGTGKRRNPRMIPTTRKGTYQESLAFDKTEHTLFGDELHPEGFKVRVLDTITERIDTLVKREGLPSSMSPEARGQYRALDKARKRVRKMDADKVPEVLEIEGEVIKPRTTEELAVIMHRQRRAALGMDMHPRVNYSAPELEFGDLQRRAIQGPDHAEQSAAAMELMINGADASDVTMTNLAMPYYMTANSAPPLGITADGMLDIGAINTMLAERKIKLSAKQLKLFDGLKLRKFDSKWLPQNELADRIKSGAVKTADMVAGAFERWAPGLTPGSMRMRLTNFTDNMWARATGAPNFIEGIVGNAREIMRVFDGLDPEIWPAVRNMQRMGEAESERMSLAVIKEFERFGAITTNKENIIRKIFLSGTGDVVRKTNQKLAHQFARIADEVPGSAKFIKLTKDLTDDQLLAVENYRQFTNFYAQKLGLADTDMYIKGYAHHVLEPKYFADGACPPEIRGLSQSGDLHLAFLLERADDLRGNQTINIVDLTDITNRMTVRKLYTEPLIKFIDSKVDAAIAKNPKKVWVKGYWETEKANWKGMPSLLEGSLDRIIHGAHAAAGIPYQPQNITRNLLAMSSLSYAAHLAGNSRYFYMNMATAITTTGAKYGMMQTWKGLNMAMSPEGQALMKATRVDKEFGKLMEYEGIGNIGQKFAKGFTDKMTHLRLPLIPSIMETEATVRGMTMFAALDEVAKKAGYPSWQMARKAPNSEHMLLDAIIECEKVNHFYGPGSKPPQMQRLSRGVGAMAAQFLSFGPKQTEQILSMTMENPGYFVRFLMLSGWVQRMAAEQLNLSVDDYVGFGYMPHNMEELSAPLVDYWGAMADASTAIMDQINGEGDPMDTAQKVEFAIKSIDALLPLSTAFGRMQAQKEMLQTEQRRSTTGELQRDIQIPQEFGEAPGEFLSVMTGLQSLEQKRLKETKKRTHRAEGEIELAKARAVEAFMALVENPDNNDLKNTQEFADTMAPLMSEILSLGGDPSSLVDVLKDATKSKFRSENMEWYIRQLMENPALRRRFMHEARKSGATSDYLIQLEGAKGE